MALAKYDEVCQQFILDCQNESARIDRLHTLSLAPDCDGRDGVFQVIHPFHPLAGRELQLVTCRQNWGEQRVYFYDEDGRLMSVPLQWTTLAAVDPFVELAAGRSAFRVTDLLELRALLAAVGRQAS